MSEKDTLKQQLKDLGIPVYRKDGKRFILKKDTSAVLKKIEANWLPGKMDPKARAWVPKVAQLIGYDIESAKAFAVAILEACNGQSEAQKVNDVLLKEKREI